MKKTSKTRVTMIKNELGLLTSTEAARLLRKPPGVMPVERCRRVDHPPYLRMGRKILYREADVLAWLESHLVTPSSTAFDGAPNPREQK
jgi:hypothetical protein